MIQRIVSVYSTSILLLISSHILWISGCVSTIPKGPVALISASMQGRSDDVKLLLESNADVNTKTSEGATALIMASLQGHEAVVKLLLDKNADVNTKTWDEGATALSLASQNGHETVVKLLLDANADVNARTFNGCTPLFIASQNGRETVVKLLLDAKADVNAKRLDGCSPLFIATQNGHEAVVKQLLDAKADVNAKGSNGASPLIKALLDGHEAIVELFLQANADVNAKALNGASCITFKKLLNDNFIIYNRDEYVYVYESYYDTTRYLEFSPVRKEIIENKTLYIVSHYLLCMEPKQNLEYAGMKKIECSNGNITLHKVLLNIEDPVKRSPYTFPEITNPDLTKYSYEYTLVADGPPYMMKDSMNMTLINVKNDIISSFGNSGFELLCTEKVFAGDTKNKLIISKKLFVNNVGEIQEDGDIVQGNGIQHFSRKLLKIIDGNIYNIKTYDME